MSHRIPALEVRLGERLGHDHYFLCCDVVRVREIAAEEKRNAQRLAELRPHEVPAHVVAVDAGEGAIDPHIRIVGPASARTISYERHRLHARQRAQLLRERLIEAQHLGIVGQRLRRSDAEHRQSLGPHTHLFVLQIAQRADQQAGADQQRQAERDLRRYHDARAAEAAAVAARRDGAGLERHRRWDTGGAA